jgi:hypothetical protein
VFLFEATTLAFLAFSSGGELAMVNMPDGANEKWVVRR